jgi:hypothetical protein
LMKPRLPRRDVERQKKRLREVQRYVNRCMQSLMDEVIYGCSNLWMRLRRRSTARELVHVATLEMCQCTSARPNHQV